MYYVSYDSNTGEVTGWRPIGEKYPTSPPTPYLTVTDAAHIEFFKSGQRMKVDLAVAGGPRLVDNPPSEEELAAKTQAQLTNAVQGYMDATARTKGYDSLLSAVTYADEDAVPEFKAEGVVFRAWRSQVWAACYEILAAVKAGTRPVPTADQLVAELPPLVLAD